MTDLNHRNNERVVTSGGNRESDRKQVSSNMRARGFRTTNQRFENQAGSRDPVTTKDLERQFEKFKLIPTKTQTIEPRLEDIKLNIDMTKLKNLSAASQKLRIILIKCCKVKRYDIIPLSLLDQLLQDTEKEMPIVKSGMEEAVICVSTRYAPHLFYLQWQEQKDRFYVITNFLTDMIKNGKIKRLCDDSHQYSGHQYKSLIGRIVTAPRVLQNEFARVVIRSFETDDDRILVKYIDYGDEAKFDLNRLYECPKEIANVPSLCFPCRLTDLDYYEEKNMNADFVGEDAYNFNQIVDFDDSYYEYCILQCSIVKKVCFSLDSQDNEPEPVYEVRLSKDQINVSLEVRKRMKERKITLAKNASRLTPQEICQLLYLDCEVNVGDYKDKHRSIKECRVSTIISPEEFYVSLVGIGCPWFNKMQTFYKDPVTRRTFRIKTERVFKARCYAWYDITCRSWNRVRVVSPPLGPTMDKKVLVWAVDRGCYIEAMMEDLMELNPDFAAEPAMSFKAHLAHIKPLSSGLNDYDSGVLPSWSVEATHFFRSNCCSDGDRVFYCITVDMDEIQSSVLSVTDKSSSSLVSVSHGIILAEKHANTGTVQAALIKAGFGMPTGPSCGRHDLIFSHISSGMRTYDGTTALVVPSYNREEIRQEIKMKQKYSFSSLSMEVMKKEMNSFRQQGARTRQISLKREGERVPFAFSGFPDLFKETPNHDHIPLIMQHRMGYVAISASDRGPGNFCIQMENKMTDLNLMTQDLSMLAYSLPCVPLQSIYPGLFAIAIPPEGEKCDFYGRVVVVSFSSFTGFANVVYIDYGFEVSVHLNSIRELPEPLARVPPFCHRVHLDFTSPDKRFMPSGATGWTPTVDVAWKKHITTWADWKPVYYAWQIGPENLATEHRIQLDDFNQTVNFDRKSMKWCAGPLRMASSYSALNQLRNHPLLKQFYVSLGITIDVEMKGGSEDLYKFKSIWQTLMELNHVEPISDEFKFYQ